MLVDLVQTSTRDGVRLDGILQRAGSSTPSAPSAPLDAVICVHGTGSNFYGSSLFEDLARHWLDRGISVLRVNTRGHDLMCNLSLTRGGGRRGGAAFELLDDCRHDLAAWITWLGDHAGSRLGLVGHSSGAVKCLYSQAHEPAETVRAIIALSPPRLSHSWFLQGEKAITFRDTILQAQSLLAVGEGNHLLDVHFPLPFVTTAAGYLEKYGTDERYNFLRFLDRLNVPTLLTFGGGEIESNVAFRDAPAAVAQVAPKIRVEVVPQADHFYSGLRQPLFEKLDKWLDSLS